MVFGYSRARGGKGRQGMAMGGKGRQVAEVGGKGWQGEARGGNVRQGVARGGKGCDCFGQQRPRIREMAGKINI